VNFKMLDGDIVFRTSNGSIARAVREGSPFSVEVDHLDEALGEGWSVLVSGRAEVISDPDVLAKVDALGLEPWAGGDRHVVVRVTPRAITGREIRRPQATD
jgi:nitroimidazol reductase NimA-like FMN-containing flavoprotein (pyridoxamine 5'-phosphate oxidase superfamily)